MPKFSLERSTLLKIAALLVWAWFAITLTTQPDSVPIVHTMTSTIGSTDEGAAIGHAGLFATLTFCGYLVLSLKVRRPIALIVTVGLAVTLALITEAIQRNVPLRSSSLVDLLANFTGIFAAAFAVSYSYFYRLYPRSQKEIVSTL